MGLVKSSVTDFCVISEVFISHLFTAILSMFKTPVK
jgi:hypothetical protein